MRDVNKFVLGMAFLRFFSGLMELLAGMIMLKLNEISKALMVNSLLAFLGPTILLSTTAIGLVGISDKLSYGKILVIFIGVGLILYAVRKVG
ncbi:YqhV family protein [Tepidibacillus sp. LV47]|uniref:YqhV family protein n=1 Tax=Tepidibacillus sp. LV47 TaxID=3398228 RepID=UPI003AADEE0B